MQLQTFLALLYHKLTPSFTIYRHFSSQLFTCHDNSPQANFPPVTYQPGVRQLPAPLLIVNYIDFKKAFDCIQRNSLLNIAAQKAVSIIRSIYMKRQCAVKIDNELGEFFEICSGVKTRLRAQCFEVCQYGPVRRIGTSVKVARAYRTSPSTSAVQIKIDKPITVLLI